MAYDVATHKFIGKQAITAQALNAPLSNTQHKKFLFSAQFCCPTRIKQAFDITP
jgi:hypothetical protein